jgi:hypothetical protein
LAFLAIPKTGTSAYAEALAPMADLSIQDPPELKHAPLIRYNRFIRPMFELVCDAQLDTMAVIANRFLGWTVGTGTDSGRSCPANQPRLNISALITS